MVGSHVKHNIKNIHKYRSEVNSLGANGKSRLKYSDIALVFGSTDFGPRDKHVVLVDGVHSSMVGLVVERDVEILVLLASLRARLVEVAGVVVARDESINLLKRVCINLKVILRNVDEGHGGVKLQIPHIVFGDHRLATESYLRGLNNP